MRVDATSFSASSGRARRRRAEDRDTRQATTRAVTSVSTAKASRTMAQRNMEEESAAVAGCAVGVAIKPWPAKRFSVFPIRAAEEEEEFPRGSAKDVSDLAQPSVCSMSRSAERTTALSMAGESEGGAGAAGMAEAGMEDSVPGV